MKGDKLAGGRHAKSLTIEDLDDGLISRPRIQATVHGRSIEDEARTILRSALGEEPLRSGADLVASIRTKVAAIGGFELPAVPREPVREPPCFDEWG